MTQIFTTGLIEARHTLPDEERSIEQAVLAEIGRLFAGFWGSRREAYDAMTAETPLALGVAFEAVAEKGVSGWWVRPESAPAGRAILFIHGGAFILGSATAYRGFASQIAARTGVAVFALDYPLAPEHPFPAAYDAAVAALRWLRRQGVTEVALTGDSAGGNLALAELRERDAAIPAILALAVFSPWTDLALTGTSFNNPETHDPIFQPQVLRGAMETYLGAADRRDGRASPLFAIPGTLPPLLIQVGSDELLLDDSRRYATAAAARGGEVRLDIYEGLHHVFQRSTWDLPSARRALDDVAAFLARHWASA